MTKKARQFAAWSALAAIVFVTVSPIGLRPGDIFPVDIDRALAFAVLAILFVLAYPRHSLTVGVVMVLGAGLIEALQMLSPTRHAEINDALVKAAGALIGVVMASAINAIRHQMAAAKRRPARTIPQRGIQVKMPAPLAASGTENLLSVQSKLIDAVYFSPKDGQLRVRFKNGHERLFSGVEESEANALASADSPGQHYVDHIRNKYKRLAA